MLESLVEAHPDDLRFIYRHFPLSGHDKAVITAEATEAAGAQGDFWGMHDMIFERFEEWAGLPVDDMPEVLTGYAQELGLDAAQFAQDLEDHTFRDKVMGQYDDAARMQLGGTPTFIFNGHPIGLQYVDALIRLIALEPLQYDAPPPQVIDPDRQYVATIRTAKGDIVIELYADTAPLNVNSFVFLAQEGWYDGVGFHRVIPGFVAQAGDPTGTGAGSPGYECSDEIGALGFDEAGIVGIANAGPNTGSSQFFITLDPQPDLSGGYTVIGKVVEGLDVALELTAREPGNPSAPAADIIETIDIEEQ